jgi:hypothetical protein
VDVASTISLAPNHLATSVPSAVVVPAHLQALVLLVFTVEVAAAKLDDARVLITIGFSLLFRTRPGGLLVLHTDALVYVEGFACANIITSHLTEI